MNSEPFIGYRRCAWLRLSESSIALVVRRERAAKGRIYDDCHIILLKLKASWTVAFQDSASRNCATSLTFKLHGGKQSYRFYYMRSVKLIGNF